MFPKHWLIKRDPAISQALWIETKAFKTKPTKLYSKCCINTCNNGLGLKPGNEENLLENVWIRCLYFSYIVNYSFYTLDVCKKRFTVENYIYNLYILINSIVILFYRIK